MTNTQYIEKALKNYPKTRNSDKLLILCVWWLQNPEYQKNFDNFFINHAISTETCRRTRQKLQEQGKYLADESVDQARYDKYETMRHAPTLENIAML